MKNLAQFLESLKWDAAKSGPIIAVEAAKLWPNDNAPNDLSAYEREMVKSGRLSVVAQNWMIALDEDNLPNAYQTLSLDEKMIFLLASLKPAELSKLTSDGPCADDLQGEPRAALLSMVPKPLRYLEGTASATRFTSQSEPVTLPEDQLSKVRIQLRKGIQVTYGASIVPPGGMRTQSLSSLSYRGENVPAVLGMDAMRMPNMIADYVGQVVPRVEQKADIRWDDPRLAKVVPLQSGKLGDLVSEIRDQTNLEIYCDRRVASLEVTAYGRTVSASDLLRGLAISVGGTVRKVGTAYVLTSRLEGEASREAKLTSVKVLGKMQIQNRLDAWKSKAKGLRLIENLGFSQDDSMNAGSIAPDLLAANGSEMNAGWVELSQLPKAVSDAIENHRMAAAESQRRFAALASAGQSQPFQRPISHAEQGSSPDPGLAGKAKVSPELGFRFVLPDGRPLDFRTFDPTNVDRSGASVVNVISKNPQESMLPIDPAALAKGSSIAIRSDDPATVTRVCSQLKALGLSEIWLDTQNKAATRSAIASGLSVDLLIHPWSVLPGESCATPDRNVIGQTGRSLSEMAGGGYDSATKTILNFKDTFAPSDPNLAQHWKRLVEAIPTNGIKKVILVDQTPWGYQAAASPRNGDTGMTFFNGVLVTTAAQGLLPATYELGYSQEMRLEFLRKNQIDPIDLIESNGWQKVGPQIPFFERPPMGPQRSLPYPDIHFPRVTPIVDPILPDAWQEMRHSWLVGKLKDLVAAMPEGLEPTEVEVGPRFAGGGNWSVAAIGASIGQYTTMAISFSPSNSEDPQAVPFVSPNFARKGPICFDLRDVPTTRLTTYFQYLFKRPGHQNPN